MVALVVVAGGLSTAVGVAVSAPGPDPTQTAVAQAFQTFEVDQGTTQIPLNSSQISTALPVTENNPSSSALTSLSQTIDWPTGNWSSPPQGSTDAIATPSSVKGGKPSISDAAASAAIALANNAFAAVTTSSELANSQTYFNNVAQDYESQGFEVVDAGTELLGFRNIVVSGTTALVDAELEPWEVFRHFSELGFTDMTAINKTVVQAALSQNANGNWEVESDKFQFVPGFGP